MRTLILLSLFACASAYGHEEREPAPPVPVDTTDEGKVYGAAWPAQAKTWSLDAAADQVAALQGKPQAFSGRITEVCQKMGCWLVLSGEQGQFARVFMHDHAYSIPKNATGPAIVYGTLTEKRLNATEVAHLADDGARPGSDTELQIDALSVLIRAEG